MSQYRVHVSPVAPGTQTPDQSADWSNHHQISVVISETTRWSDSNSEAGWRGVISIEGRPVALLSIADPYHKPRSRIVASTPHIDT